MFPLPSILHHESADSGEDRYVLALDPGHPAFQGHFPGDPILPGVVQVDWVIRLGVQGAGKDLAFREIRNLKFFDLIRPGSRLELLLRMEHPEGRLHFSYQEEGVRKSSGIVVFSESLCA